MRAEQAVTNEGLIGVLRASVIGEGEVIDTPFGERRVTYADYTASGKAVSFIEDFIRETVLPLYANTHTEDSATGLQMTRLREEARAAVGRSVGATEEHAVIFCGTGSTGAIDKFVALLGLRIPTELDRRYGLTNQIPETDRPVVFVGPYEHHSNELSWRESICDVVTISEDGEGGIDLAELKDRLEEFAERPLRIGSFSAASNVTGILTDVHAVAALLHEHGALALFDYAAAAPYVPLNMGGRAEGETYFDAIFISPHKFVGGPGTPGVLIVRKELLTNPVPTVPGGGTVSYVSPVEHRYLEDRIAREEGGTPGIVESIRAGLVFKLKDAVGADEIKLRESDFARRAVASWQANPNIQILGNPDAERLSIVSFVVRHGDRLLHHNFVVTLLNDLFGIQARGGCSCAGPYGHRLLSIDVERSKLFETEVLAGYEGIKPGWARVNFNYFISEETFSFIVDAVRLIADEGWRLLPEYEFEPVTGRWVRQGWSRQVPVSLDNVAFSASGLEHSYRRRQSPEDALTEYLEEARSLLAERPIGAAPPSNGLPEDFEALRWFVLPQEI